jgi:hypothetical protein
MGQRRDFVIVFASSSLGRFRELAGSCTRQGLLGDFLLVDESGAAELHVDQKTTPLADHLAFLATRPGGTEAVTVVALVCGRASEDHTKSQRMSLVRDLRVRCREMKIAFREGTISVPIGENVLSPTFIEPDWAFNLVVVPQDWTGEQGQIGVPISEKFAEDIAFNVVMSATGLWAWNDGAPLYTGLLEEHVSNPPIRLARAATRIVPLGDVANAIAFAAMDPSNNWPKPPDCEKHPNGPQFVQKAVEALSAIPEVGMTFLEPPPIAQESRQRVGILDAIVIYFSALVANLIGIPKRAWNEAKEKVIRGVENYVQNRTFQNESKLVVRYGGRLREDDFAGSATQRIRAIESDSGVEVPAVIPNPQAWRILVRTVLGSVDGDPPGDDVGYKAPQFRGMPAVVASREVVAPNPATPHGGMFDTALQVNGNSVQVRIRPFDSIRYRELTSQLSKTERGDAPAAANSGQFPYPAPSSEAATETNDPQLQLEKREVDQTLKLIEDWAATRRDTLLWSISRFLDGQIVEVARRLEASVQRVVSIPERIAAADAKQKKAAKRGKWLARLLILLLMFAIIFPFLPPVASAGLLAGGALAVALFFLPYMALLGVLTAWLATARTQVREQYRMQRDLVKEYEAATTEREHYWREMHRLEYFHIQFMDWAEILADVVWRPFGSIDTQSHQSLAVPDVRSISFQFARPKFDDLKVKREQLAMRERVAGKGWLNGVFGSLRRAFEDEYSQLVTDDSPGARHPEMDTSLDDEGYKVQDFIIYRPRGHFLKMVKEGVLSPIIADSKAAELRAAVSRTDPARLLEHVDTHAFVNVSGSIVSRDPQEFLLSILDLENVPKFERFVFRTGEKTQLSVGAVYWSSVGVEPPAKSHVNEIAEAMPHREEKSAQFLAASRLEISQARFDAAELRFLEQAEQVNVSRVSGPISDGPVAPID